MPKKKRCKYHRIKPERLVSCVSCHEMVCVDDSYPLSMDELEQNAPAMVRELSRKQSPDTTKRVRMCIPCHAEYRKSQFLRISGLVPYLLGIVLSLMVIVLGFPFLEAIFRSAWSPVGNDNVLMRYGSVFAVLLTFFMAPTLAATMISVYLYQKWKTVKKFQFEKELFLKSVNES